jgi:excisionase family DNA binding protein
MEGIHLQSRTHEQMRNSRKHRLSLAKRKKRIYNIGSKEQHPAYQKEDKIMKDKKLPEIFTVSDLEKILKISRTSAYTLVNSGRIRAHRIGKSIRITQSALMEFLNEQNQAN